MQRPSLRWWRNTRDVSQPSQPYPNLVPTPRTAPLCGYPNHPNLFAFRAYTHITMFPIHRFLYVRIQVRMVGTSQAQHGFRCPNLNPTRLGWLGQSIAPWIRAAIARVLPGRFTYGLRSRKHARLGGYELWFNPGFVVHGGSKTHGHGCTKTTAPGLCGMRSVVSLLNFFFSKKEGGRGRSAFSLRPCLVAQRWSPYAVTRRIQADAGVDNFPVPSCRAAHRLCLPSCETICLSHFRNVFHAARHAFHRSPCPFAQRLPFPPGYSRVSSNKRQMGVTEGMAKIGLCRTLIDARMRSKNFPQSIKVGTSGRWALAGAELGLTLKSLWAFGRMRRDDSMADVRSACAHEPWCDAVGLDTQQDLPYEWRRSKRAISSEKTTARGAAQTYRDCGALNIYNSLEAPERPHTSKAQSRAGCLLAPYAGESLSAHCAH